MSDIFLHGIRTIESVTGTVAVVEVSSSVIGIFGTAEKAEPMKRYHTTNLEDAEKVFGEGSILSALRRIHKYVPNNSVISIPLGKDADFPDKPPVVTSGVTLSSSTAKAFIDTGAGKPVVLSNPKNYKLTYASSVEATATVDASTGVVTPVAVGETVITVTATEPTKPNKRASGAISDTLTYTLTVEQTDPNAALQPSGAELSASVADVILGGDAMPIALSNPNNLLVTWSSSDDTVAIVDAATGLVSPVGVGTATLTATLDANATHKGAKLTAELTVKKADDALLAKFIKALPLMRGEFQEFGFFSKINIAPGIIDKPGALGAAIGAVNKIRGIWIADPPKTVTTKEDARAHKNQFTNTRAYMCWPRPKVLDSAGAVVVDWYAPSMAGLIAQVDRNQTDQQIVEETGYWCSPSNYVMIDVVGSSIELDYVPNDTDCDVNYLNSQGIATLINMGGWRNFGNYSTAYPDNTSPMAFISWRRTMDIIEESIEYFSRQFLDFPMFTSPTDIANTVAGRVRDSVNDYLRSKEGTALVYSSIAILPSDNPLNNLLQGKITYRYKATPPVPMQTIEYVAEVYVEGLQQAFTKLFQGGN